MPAIKTERPYVLPRLMATTDALDFVPLEPLEPAEEDVVAAPPEPAPPKVPSDPADVAAAEPPDFVDVDEVTLTRVGFCAPHGWAVRQLFAHALLPNPQLFTH